MPKELFRLPQKVPLIFFFKLGRVDDAILSLLGVSGRMEGDPPYESPELRGSPGDWLEGRRRLESRVRMLLPLDLLFPGGGVVGSRAIGMSISVLSDLGSAASGEDEWVRDLDNAPGVVGYAPGMEYVEFWRKKSGVLGRPC